MQRSQRKKDTVMYAFILCLRTVRDAIWIGRSARNHSRQVLCSGDKYFRSALHVISIGLRDGIPNFRLLSMPYADVVVYVHGAYMVYAAVPSAYTHIPKLEILYLRLRNFVNLRKSPLTIRVSGYFDKLRIKLCWAPMAFCKIPESENHSKGARCLRQFPARQRRARNRCHVPVWMDILKSGNSSQTHLLSFLVWIHGQPIEMSFSHFIELNWADTPNYTAEYTLL